MRQNETNTPGFAEFFEMLSEIVAEKVTSRLVPLLLKQEGSKAVPTDEKPIRGQRALCHWLGMSTATLNQMLRRNEIPYRRVGNRYLFFPTEVNQALRGGGGIR